MSRFFCYNTNSGRALAEPPELLSQGHPGKNGGGLMGEKRDKTLYEWIVLIIKLLGALTSLLAVIAELIR